MYRKSFDFSKKLSNPSRNLSVYLKWECIKEFEEEETCDVSDECNDAITTSKQTDKFLIVIALAKLRLLGEFVNKWVVWVSSWRSIHGLCLFCRFVSWQIQCGGGDGYITQTFLNNHVTGSDRKTKTRIKNKSWFEVVGIQRGSEVGAAAI